MTVLGLLSRAAENRAFLLLLRQHDILAPCFAAVGVILVRFRRRCRRHRRRRQIGPLRSVVNFSVIRDDGARFVVVVVETKAEVSF